MESYNINNHIYTIRQDKVTSLPTVVIDGTTEFPMVNFISSYQFIMEYISIEYTYGEFKYEYKIPCNDDFLKIVINLHTGIGELYNYSRQEKSKYYTFYDLWELYYRLLIELEKRC